MQIEKIFEIRDMRRIYTLTMTITAFTVAIPVISIATVIFLLGGRNPLLYLVYIGPAFLIPLLITPPLAITILNMFRVQMLTIQKVDEYIRYDTLTGVLTRAYLLGKMKEILPLGGAFLMVDADHFKAVNDNFGHDVGDEALKRLAEVLRKALTTDALIGRLGGEEFGVFLPGADDAAASKAASDLCALMRQEARIIAGRELNLTVSIGCAVHRTRETLEKTIKLADAALYHAKRTGRDRYFVAGATDTMPALILKSSMAE